MSEYEALVERCAIKAHERGYCTWEERIRAILAEVRRTLRDVTPEMADAAPHCEHQDFLDMLAASALTPEWPSGCRHPNSCASHGQCMYVGCVHQGKAIALAVSPLTPPHEGE